MSSRPAATKGGSTDHPVPQHPSTTLGLPTSQDETSTNGTARWNQVRQLLRPLHLEWLASSGPNANGNSSNPISSGSSNTSSSLTHDQQQQQVLSSGKSTTRTLSSLVAVHHCILQATFAANESLHEAVNEAAKEATSPGILSGNQVSEPECHNDAERLLWLQFHMHRHGAYRSTNASLPGHVWYTIVLPLLFPTYLPPAAETMALLGDAHVSNALLEALLEACGSLESFASHADADATWWNQSITLIHTVLTRCWETLSLTDWSTACRVLVRLSPPHAAHASHWLDTLVYAVEVGVPQSSRLGLDAAAHVVRPLTQWILPALVHELVHSRQPTTTAPWRLDRVGRTVWDTYATGWESNSPTPPLPAVLMSVTTVVCALVPVLPRTADESTQHGLVGPRLWDLIRECLSQGLEVLHTPSTARSDGSDRLYWHKLHRRRGLYLLRWLVQDEADQVDWRNYVACFETMEMESEPHLIDQVWTTVAKLFAVASVASTATTATPSVSWEWMQLLLGRILVSPKSPVVRKLALYRLLQGQAGIVLSVPHGTDSASRMEPSGAATTGPTKSKRATKQPVAAQPGSCGAPLTMLTVEFLFRVVIPSLDSLCTSVGTTMQGTAATMAGTTHNGTSGSKVAVACDMIQLLCDFVHLYVRHLWTETGDAARTKLRHFFEHLWSSHFVDAIHDKIVVRLFSTVEHALQANPTARILIGDAALQTVAATFQLAFSDGSVVPVYRCALLKALASMLEHSTAVEKYMPLSVLSVLALFPVQLLHPETQSGSTSSKTSDNDAPSWIEQDPALVSLRNWLTAEQLTAAMGPNVAAAVATAYVDGMLLPATSSNWDPGRGSTRLEHNMARAVALFCILPTFDATTNGTQTAGEYLWPAIHKGLAHAPAAIGLSWTKADRVARALLLLESGVRLRVLSGMGNGDLVVDKKTQQMLPPPPTIEVLLSNCVSFDLHRLRNLVETTDTIVGLGSTPEACSYGSRSSEARVFSASYAQLVTQLTSLSTGFLSSMAIPAALDLVLQENIDLLVPPIGATVDDNGNAVLQVALVYTALCCGGEVSKTNTLPLSSAVLEAQFSEDFRRHRNVQASRSIFQNAKWGALSLLLPKLWEADDQDVVPEVSSFVARLFDQAVDSVNSTPSNALVPLFRCVVTATKRYLLEAGRVDRSLATQTQPLARFISTLLDLMDGSDNSNDSMYMMDEICSLIFQPALMLDEYNNFQDNPDCETPIRDAFRRFVRMAGTQRPHIYRVVLCRICPSWLAGAGLCAIPYRDDIANLLVHKEDVVPVASAYTQSASSNDLPFKIETPETSLARSIVLVFVSKLPQPGPTSALSPIVHNDLLCHVIQHLMELVAQPPISGSGLIMLGTSEYCIKMRALQALCVLARFVTLDIANDVCAGCIEAMGKQNAHNQLRYFVEIFSLQFARMYPAVFGKALVEQLSRTDLSLQMVASLMIITGNLIVGRYKKDFFVQYDGAHFVSLDVVLAGILPWLASTQGFTRAIAQLLAHKLIPRVIDIKDNSPDDSSFYLRSMYRFLDENPEMRRLRNKQAKFFERYEVDSVCTPDGVLSIPVDEGNEADPVHMVDVIKDCLQQVYDESHVDRAPMWRQVQVAESLQGQSTESSDACTATELNFQRKIIPLDALNLALEGLRDQRLRNTAGRYKQNLIVCASLIDKIPNLGGLARTCEIFAAQQLIVPDLQITQMDNFNSLSVGAGEWIDIAECREENLLAWLRERKRDGYHVVGLEQTSSSVSLATYQFARAFGSTQPTILLLGKEKEGIPVEFLQAVDQCLEIPQFGIIRSLNVHVSAAIAIWEFTKQRLLTPAEESTEDVRC